MNETLETLFRIYEPNEKGYIMKGSKFLYQPIFVPFFYEYYKLGYHEEGLIEINNDDKKLFISLFPRLRDKTHIYLTENNNRIEHKLLKEIIQ